MNKYDLYEPLTFAESLANLASAEGGFLVLSVLAFGLWARGTFDKKRH